MSVGMDMRDGSPLRLEAAEREYIHALYLAHSGALRGYAASLGFFGETADDLLQETFLVAVRRVKALQECREPRAYLVQILRNVIGSHLRRAKAVAGLLEKLQHIGGEDAEGYRDEPDPELQYRGLISEEELRLLLRFYLEGRSVKELAAELGIDTGACNMRLKRARERLRAALEKDGML